MSALGHLQTSVCELLMSALPALALNGTRAYGQVKITARPRNRLLSALSNADFGLLRPHLTLVDFPLRYDLENRTRQLNTSFPS